MMGKFRSEEGRWKALLAGNAIAFSIAAYAACPPPYQNAAVLPVFIANTATLVGAVTAVDGALSSQLQVNNERLMAAIAVLTKQKALAANQTAEASRTAAQMAAVGIGAIENAARVRQARLDYGPEFGQGYSACTVNSKRQVIAEQDAAMEGERRRRVMSEVRAAPGQYADPKVAQRELVNNRAEFCTPDQVRAGFCASVGKAPGADLNVGTLFEPAMEGESLYRAKQLFVNNAVGLPDAPVPASQAKTPAAQAYVLSKARKDALVSPAINSFKAIQLDYSGVNSAHGASGLPVAVQLRNEVARYGGDSIEHESWTKALTGMVERGALVELLKMKALDLTIMERQYRQAERMEANLATLVAMELESSGITGKAREAASDILKQRINQQVQ